MEKIRWEVDPEAEAMYPKAYPASLIATMNDGNVLTSHVDYPKGDPENPASLQEIKDKFHSLTADYIEEEKRNQVINMIEDLENVGNISAIANVLR